MFLQQKSWLKIAIALFIFLIITFKLFVPKSDLWKQQKIASMYSEYVKQFPTVPSISVEDLAQLKQEQKVIIVDVRTEAERFVSMIPGAISQAEFEENSDRYKDYPIVVYCTIGYRSGKYIQTIQKQNQNLQLFNLEGSLLAWSHIDGELVDLSGKTKKIHVFGKKWKLVADGYEAIW